MASSTANSNGRILSAQQRRYWALHHAQGSQGLRAQCRILLEGTVATERLRAALLCLGDGYEAFRTSVERRAGPLCDEHGRRRRGEGQRRARLAASNKRLEGEPFDPGQGRCFRSVIAREGADRVRLLLAVSSAAGDGRSLLQLARE